MKKTIMAAMLSAFVALTSCGTSVEESETTIKNDVTATFSVQTPVKTRATGLTRYIVEAYENNDLNTQPLRIESAQGELRLTLKKNTEYTFLFWADNGTIASPGVSSAGYYNTASLKTVKVTMSKILSPGGRAYCQKLSFNSNDFDANKFVVLKNAVAEVTLVESAGFATDNNTITITYPSQTTFNVATGVATEVPMEIVRTFTGVGKIAKNAVVVTDYILAPESEKRVATIKVGINNEPKKSINNVPVQCNYKTNITGEYSNMYATSFSANSEIDPWGAPSDVDLVHPPTKTVTINGVDFKFILVKAGTFEKGCPTTEPGYQSDIESLSWVKITKDYYIGETEVTQAQWKAIMGTNPSYQTPIAPDLNTDNYPAEMVSWLMICGGTYETTTVTSADCFLTKISTLTEKEFRLPTSAEWEYAARGGHKITTYMTYPGTNYANLVEEYAWCRENAFVDGYAQRHRTATKKPNILGLYDMAGNVFEWCHDWFSYTPPIGTVSLPLVDPQGPASGIQRIARGGCFNNLAQNLRIASVASTQPFGMMSSFGFRLVMVP